MYKLFLAATILTSVVSAQYGGESYSSGGSAGSYEAAVGGQYGSESPAGGEYATPPVAEKPKQEPCKPKPMPGGGMMHSVIVGGEGGLIYSPESVIAEPGDTIRFHFLKMNHTVTQSTFDKPCVKKADGEDSQFKPSQLDRLDPESKEAEDPSLIWDYQVADMEPTWWYCKQRTGGHCGKGMVFAINPTAEKTFAKFLDSAQQQNGTEGAVPPPPQEGGDVYLPPDAPPAKDPKWEQGWNAGGDGACSCQCLCGGMDFPSQYGWGKDNKGGAGGYGPAPWNTGSMGGESYAPEQPPADSYVPGGDSPEQPPADSYVPEQPPADSYVPGGETPEVPVEYVEGGDSPEVPAEAYTPPEGGAAY